MQVRRSSIATVEAALAAAFLVFASPAGAQQVKYTVTDLGVTDDLNSEAHDINQTGDVVGRRQRSDGAHRAFFWSPERGTEDLGTLGGAFSVGLGINDAREVVGYAQTARGVWHAYLWTAAAGMRDVGTLGGAFSEARAINDSGAVTGNAMAADGNSYPVRWVGGGTPQVLGFLSGGRGGHPQAINNAGEIAGFAPTLIAPTTWTHAFVWNASTGMRDLDPGGVRHSWAYGLNDAGHAVGAVFDVTTNVHRAVLWNAAGEMQQLAGHSSRATDINNRTEVVGEVVANPRYAFLWRGGVLVDLNDLIDPASGWHFFRADAINDAGQIVGVGVNARDGKARAILLTPDTTAPTVSITRPASRTYLLNEPVLAQYSCDDDAGTGVAACAGPVADGNAIDTAVVGAKTFSVTATDKAGNTATQSIGYDVAYGTCLLYDPSRAYRAGSTAPLRLQLCDTAGANVSSSTVEVHAVGLTKQDSTASGTIEPETAGNADQDFRFDATLGGTGGYIYNLSTKGLTTGTWSLSFTVSGDPSVHRLQFDVR